jgi:cell volume regulation protein A
VSAQDLTLTVSLILACGLFARLLADIVRLPEIVLMVGLGVLIGPSALDIADAPIGSVGVELILTVGVGFILFYGGLSLSLHVLRTVSIGLSLLVLPGVILTAFVTGIAAMVAFGLPVESGFLMGAVLAPTDPAILIPLFSRMRVRPKVAQTVIAESAFNDPTGAILALAIAGVVVTGHASVTSELVSFVRNLGSSAAIGIVVGFVLAATVSSTRIGIWRESPAIAALVAVSAGYFSLETIDGSGYLGAFVAGLIVGNMQLFGLDMNTRHERELMSFVSSVADIVTMLVFVTLGANLPLEDIWRHLWAGLAVLAVFVLVARPLAVLVCTLPDRRAGWTRPERLFLCWTRETGVVPAALAGILLQTHVPHASLIVSVVALAIVTTLLVQATTAGWLAGRLGLIEPELTIDGLEPSAVAGGT